MAKKISLQNDFDHFGAIFNCTSIGMAIVSIDGEFLKVNKELVKILGYSEEELLNLDFQAITVDEDTELSAQVRSDFLAGKINSTKLEKHYVGKHGNIVSASVSIFAVKNKSDELEYFVTQIEDITVAKEKEKETELLLSSVNDGYWDWHITTEYEYMSPKFWSMLGYDHKTKEHHPSEWQKLIFEEDLHLIRKNLEKHFATKGVHPFYQEVRYRHKNGSTVWVLCKGTVVEWDDEQPIRMCGSHTDITLLKQYKDELANEKRKRVHQSQISTIGQLGGKIAHEINNPLAIVRGNAELMKRKIVKGKSTNEETVNYADSIITSIDRVTNIVKGLRTLTRDDSNANFQEVDVDDLIENAMSLCRDRYQRHGVNFKVDVERPGMKVWGLKVQLSQVLINLINNALDAVRNTEEKEVTLKVSEDNDVLFSITDSGSGISKDIEDKIMEPFYSTKSDIEGIGLGLSISKDIAEAHLGNLEYDKDSDATRFVLTLPKIAC